MRVKVHRLPGDRAGRLHQSRLSYLPLLLHFGGQKSERLKRGSVEASLERDLTPVFQERFTSPRALLSAFVDILLGWNARYSTIQAAVLP